MRKIAMSLLMIFSLTSVTNCSDDTRCDYIKECIPQTVLKQDFYKVTDPATQGWKLFNSGSGGSLEIGDVTNQYYMSVGDGSGITFLYNDTYFPKNWTNNTCELHLDVRAKVGVNGTSLPANNFINLYQGNPNNFGSQGFKRIYFTLNSNYVLNTADPNFKHLIIPLGLATSNSNLPSNSYGTWNLGTAVDYIEFNQIMQNADGIGLNIDVGNATEGELWQYDNFELKSCCK